MVHLKQKPFKCITCGQLFSLNPDLKKHVDAVHLGKRPFTCGDCGATYAQAANLKAHVSSQHSSAPPRYSCTHPGCESIFKSQDSLNLHMMNHTGERPFPCPYERFVRFCVAICNVMISGVTRGSNRRSSSTATSRLPRSTLATVWRPSSSTMSSFPSLAR